MIRVLSACKHAKSNHGSQWSVRVQDLSDKRWKVTAGVCCERRVTAVYIWKPKRRIHLMGLNLFTWLRCRTRKEIWKNFYLSWEVWAGWRLESSSWDNSSKAVYSVIFWFWVELAFIFSSVIVQGKRGKRCSVQTSCVSRAASQKWTVALLRWRNIMFPSWMCSGSVPSYWVTVTGGSIEWGEHFSTPWSITTTPTHTQKWLMFTVLRVHNPPHPLTTA